MKAKVTEVINAYNHRTKGWTKVIHHGERVLRNVRWVNVAGVNERIAECTIRGEEVHVGVSWGQAGIINQRAWDLVYQWGAAVQSQG